MGRADLDPHVTLLQWLRANGRTGTREGCAEGECGACAVVLRRSRPGEVGSHYETVNSCLLPVVTLHGAEVTTVEGVECPDGSLHAVQQAMVAQGGSQCGYCTPGFVMSLFSEYYRRAQAATSGGSVAFDPESISGNLCRCTGYKPILEAGRALPLPTREEPQLVQLRRPAEPQASFECAGKAARFIRPTCLAELWAAWERYPEAVLLGGGTDLMVNVTQRYVRYSEVISIESLAELQEFRIDPDCLVLGAGLPLSWVESLLEEQRSAGDLREELQALRQLLPLFSSRAVRNRATLGGNLATASPIGDAAPVLLALNAQLILSSSAAERCLPLREFFVGYRRTGLRPQELIRAVRIPRPGPQYQRFYKVSKRKMDDISTVSACFGLSLDCARRVTQFRAGWGGVAATPLYADALERLALGRSWDETTVARLAEQAKSLGSPQSDLRGSAQYRQRMLSQCLWQFYEETQQSPTAELEVLKK